MSLAQAPRIGALERGVTVIVPHEVDPFREKVPAASTVINDAASPMPSLAMLQDARLDVLFEAAAEATEQAIVNAIAPPRSSRSRASTHEHRVDRRRRIGAHWFIGVQGLYQDFEIAGHRVDECCSTSSAPLVTARTSRLRTRSRRAFQPLNCRLLIS